MKVKVYLYCQFSRPWVLMLFKEYHIHIDVGAHPHLQEKKKKDFLRHSVQMDMSFPVFSVTFGQRQEIQ